MKGKQLLVLVIVALALMAAALLSSRSRAPAAGALMGRLVLPDLPINDIVKVTITSSAGSATLSKEGDTWVSGSRFSYPLDFQKIKGVVLKLSEMKIGQAMRLTDKQRADMKMLEPGPGSTGQTGTRMDLFAANDRKVASLLIGETRQRKAKGQEAFGGYGGYPDGQYVSTDGGKTVYLVKDVLDDVSAKNQDWLDAELLNINPGDVTAITLTSRDKKEVKLIRNKDDSKLAVEGLTADEESDSEKLYNVESALSYLRFDDVVDPALSEAETGFDKPAMYQATTAKGQVITVRIGNSPTNSTDCYARFAVALKPAETNVPAATNAVSGKADERASLELETANLSAKLGKWTYRLASHKATALTSTRDQLVKKKEPPKAETAEPAATNAVAPVTAVEVPASAPAVKAVEPAPSAPKEEKAVTAPAPAPAPETGKPAAEAENKKP